ncbi:GIY-YIG nuclease family protein [Aestuariibacter salexigens]|uniref:GIY-YIG nuclease family protein n=1 Tax=Aestuariibacter salexigens TaxID=226010 RepID=UPI00047A2004|nr:GIY-YIG nuclease family protein [Aestuariibacter salexigens]
MKQPAVYLLKNHTHSVLYVGVTSNLIQRIYQHKTEQAEGFSQRYHCHELVYYELWNDMYSAICREKCIKKWRRAWKERLINSINPQWRDLYDELL